MDRLTFPKSSRIRKRKDFKAIAHKRNRHFGSAVVIDYRLSTYPKLGITAPRQFGNAVKRNLFKRRVREAFRLSTSKLGPLEMVVLPRRGEVSFSLELIIKDLLECSHEHAQPAAAKSR